MDNRPPLMSHAERQALIRRPFPWVRYVERSTWAGVLLPTEKEFSDRATAARGRRVAPKPNLDGVVVGDGGRH
jgi:hypothetical protein